MRRTSSSAAVGSCCESRRLASRGRGPSARFSASLIRWSLGRRLVASSARAAASASLAPFAIALAKPSGGKLQLRKSDLVTLPASAGKRDGALEVLLGLGAVAIGGVSGPERSLGNGCQRVFIEIVRTGRVERVTS